MPRQNNRIWGVITRFAPSPTGYLHVGHALAALAASQFVEENGGRFLLRIEDIDLERCRPEYEAAIYEDLSWLGLKWEKPVRRQSEHMPEYADALQQLKDMSVIYPCFCSRRKVSHLAGVLAQGQDEPLYPGTCRELPPNAVAERVAEGQKPCWRLNATAAAELTGPLSWWDRETGKIAVRPDQYGDAVIARRDVPTSYHLAVTVDDHRQRVTHVVRGRDLFSATHVHRTLQALLGFESPEYFHHELLLDKNTGRKLSKRDRSSSLRSLRERGVSPAELIRSLDVFWNRTAAWRD